MNGKIIFLKEYHRLQEGFNFNAFIYELTNLSLNIDIKLITPYFTIFIALLLVSKIPTLSFKKISISSKATIFLLLTVGLIFIALLFYTFETLLVFGLFYLF